MNTKCDDLIDCENPVPLEYVCKFCRKPGTTYYEQTCSPIRVEMWRGMLACNRCADYQSGYRDIAGAVRFICETLIRLCDSTSNEEIKNEAWGCARKKLDDLTKKFAEHVCRFWHKPTQWEESFTDCILKKPGECLSTLAWYAKNIRA